MLLILFGKIGAGKTFIGKILERDFGFVLYDADQDLPDIMLHALLNNQVVTNKMRDIFFDRVIKRIKKLSKKGQNIVVTQTFLKEKYRKQVLKNFQQAKFVLVKTRSYLRIRRLANRRNYRFTKAYIKQMDNNFEMPRIRYSIIINNNQGDEAIIEQLRIFFLQDLVFN